jgi:hypothetical protein
MTITTERNASAINAAIKEQAKKGLHCIERRAIGPKGQTIKLFFEPLPENGKNGKTHNMK